MTLPVMRFLAALLLSGIGCMAGGKATDRGATRLTVPDPPFRNAQVVMAKSKPPQFRVNLTRDMPTPGWKFEIESVEVDAEAGRILVRVTEQAPHGMVAQMIKPTRLSLDLGVLAPGRYVLELWVRRGAKNEYHRLQAMVLVAS